VARDNKESATGTIPSSEDQGIYFMAQKGLKSGVI
jgi:hypothetical protein